ncbi:MAG: ABC transporter permease subunit [Rhizobiales bacterium]|nr:ABC transporter permease subunit [Hyphomicrobiales bacterium]MBO6700561.1 ABC transporter permease subunit [Hyphomicrobiales bacterium]MBO6738097.1 ABC transporter permease subunit [Hyphomicrobiales bacterium]MBO6913596.1 ABC transporter permease subunit [Hyphomicrobiales bacterium]MBO6955235.1 ABC transporter permease subunit [Hyphomicrobiales bacterium]
MNQTASETADRAGRNWGRFFVIAVPYLWLLIFFLAPFAIVLRISFSEVAIAMPPYLPVFDLSEGLDAFWQDLRSLSFENYIWLAGDPLYINAYRSSLWIAAVSTVLTLLIGFPIAYGMARAPHNVRPILLMMIILPFWTSFLIRVYAWIGILKPEGLLTLVAQTLGLIGSDDQLRILSTNTAVYIGIVYSYLPFMVLPLYAALERMDGSLLEAAQDLGCPPLKTFWVITVPLAIPGIIAGCFLVFIPAVGEFVIPDLLGGSDTLMIGRTLWAEFFSNRDWPVSSAVAVILLLVLIIPIVAFQHFQQKQQERMS